MFGRFGNYFVFPGNSRSLDSETIAFVCSGNLVDLQTIADFPGISCLVDFQTVAGFPRNSCSVDFQMIADFTGILCSVDFETIAGLAMNS